MRCRFFSLPGLIALVVLTFLSVPFATHYLTARGEVSSGIAHGLFELRKQDRPPAELQANRAAAPGADHWSPLGEGLNGSAPALLVYDSLLIVGGGFTQAGSVIASHIAAWDGSQWSPFGTGIDGNVFALAEYGGRLIAGGYFDAAGSTPVNNIAAWDGAEWTALGEGTNDVVAALAVYRGRLIAGGTFTQAGGGSANCIAAWDGVSWSPLGAGMSGTAIPAVLELIEFQGKLIAAGRFASPAWYIAAWDGQNWSSLGSGTGPDQIAALTVYDGRLIAGGYFTEAGGVPANKVAAWDGAAWSALGDGLQGYDVYAATVYGDRLIVGGNFFQAGATPCSFIAAWNGSTWSTLGSGADAIVWSLSVFDNRLIAGGDFDSAGREPALHIAQWTCPVGLPGDVNKSGTITAADIIVLVNFAFKSGHSPSPCEAAGDVDCSGEIGAADIISLITYVFKGGAQPCDMCGMIPGIWACDVTPQPAPSIWPLVIGNRWTYLDQLLDTAGNVLQTDTTVFLIAEDTMIQGETWYILTINGAHDPEMHPGKERSDGIWEWDGSEGVLVWKYPTAVGDTWLLGTTTASTESVGVAVTVPAGTFSCINYKWVDPNDVDRTRSYHYLSSGIGWILGEEYYLTAGGYEYLKIRNVLLSYELH